MFSEVKFTSFIKYFHTCFYMAKKDREKAKWPGALATCFNTARHHLI